MILRLTSGEQMAKFPVHSALLKRKWRMFGHRPEAKKIFLPIKGKQTSTCFEIHFCDFCCSAVEVSLLTMASNEFNSLRKTFDVNPRTYIQIHSPTVIQGGDGWNPLRVFDMLQ